MSSGSAAPDDLLAVIEAANRLWANALRIPDGAP
jgi:hypothetical protein